MCLLPYIVLFVWLVPIVFTCALECYLRISAISWAAPSKKMAVVKIIKMTVNFSIRRVVISANSAVARIALARRHALRAAQGRCV